ncbi:MAG: carbohydrate porin [Acetobacteraceae bacterium]|nr:carbohydrate porin [Acetobacteraceae bacterium]
MQVWSQAKLVNVDPSSPASVGIPRSLRKNYSIYAVADQLVYRPAGAKEGGIGLFARVMGAPGDRNLSNFLRRWGVTYRGVIPGARMIRSAWAWVMRASAAQPGRLRLIPHCLAARFIGSDRMRV